MQGWQQLRLNRNALVDALENRVHMTKTLIAALSETCSVI